MTSEERHEARYQRRKANRQKKKDAKLSRLGDYTTHSIIARRKLDGKGVYKVTRLHYPFRLSQFMIKWTKGNLNLWDF